MFHKIPIFNILQGAFLESAIGIKRDFRELDFITKNKNDFISQCEKRTFEICENQIYDTNIQSGISFNEQVVRQSRNGMMFCICPLIGKVNFRHGIPFFGTLINIYENSELVVGAFCETLQDAIFFAKKNEGSFLNFKQIKVSSGISEIYMTRDLNFNCSCINFGHFVRGKVAKVSMKVDSAMEIDFARLLVTEAMGKFTIDKSECIASAD